MKKAFTLIELIITVTILGILASAILPVLQGHILNAKEASAKENLRILRNAIELYENQNGIAPGYDITDPTKVTTEDAFITQLAPLDPLSQDISEDPGFYGTDGSLLKTVLREFPENPFNGLKNTHIIPDGVQFPARPVSTDIYGWIYQPSTKNIRLNWDSIDKNKTSYFDY